jgi:hypothetical protein
MTQEQRVIRTGALCAMLGALITIFAIMLGPMDLDAHDTAAVMAYFAANAGRLQLHGLGVTVGKLLLLGGFVTLYTSLRNGPGGSWALLGLAAAVATTVINIIGPMMGGSVLPAVAQAYVQAPAAEATVAQGFHYLYEALLGPSLLSLAAALLPFAFAVLQSQRYPAWLGWMAIIVTVWLTAGGVAFFLAGPAGAAGIMNYFAPAFMLAIAWVFVVGVFLWRLAREVAEQSPRWATAHHGE